MDQENIESKSEFKDETNNSLNLQSTQLETNSDTIIRGRSNSKAYQMKSAVNFFFFFSILFY